MFRISTFNNRIGWVFFLLFFKIDMRSTCAMNDDINNFIDFKSWECTK